MQKWEYLRIINSTDGRWPHTGKVIYLNDQHQKGELSNVGDVINELGDPGWEMVSAQVYDERWENILFKRPKP
jgi:hypothetical protein